MSTEDHFHEQLRNAARTYHPPGEVPRERMWARIAAARRSRRGRASWRKWLRPPLSFAWWPATAATLLVAGILIGRSWTDDKEPPASAAQQTAPAGQHSSPVAQHPDGLARQSPRAGQDLAHVGESPTPVTQQSGATTAAHDATAGGFPATATTMNAGATNTNGAKAARRRMAFAQAAQPYLGRIEALLTVARHEKTTPGGADLSAWARELLTETRLLIDSPASEEEELGSLLADLELILAQIVRRSTGPSPMSHPRVRQTLEERALLARIRNRLPAGESGVGI